jgi:hypothetical protein
MVATHSLGTPSPDGRLEAVLTLAGRYRQQASVDTAVRVIDAATVEVEVPAGYEQLRFAWLEFFLPEGLAIRPLVELAPPSDGGLVVGRIRHLFPDQRRALEASLLH